MINRHERCGGKLVWFYDEKEWTCQMCGATPDPQPDPPVPSDYRYALNRDPLQIDIEEEIEEIEEIEIGSTADYLKRP